MFDFDMPQLDWRVCHIPKPKKPGEFRKITIPNDRLKEVQRFIYRELRFVKGLRPSAFAHGFVPFRNTSTGVKRHDTMSPLIICMDMKDFFDNFPLAPIRRRMLDAGLPEWLADKVLKACSYNGTIPQGGPCSPFLTNVGMFETDLKLAVYARNRGFTYSRYADDLTFAYSGEMTEEERKGNFGSFMRGIEALLMKDLGIRVNRKKTHRIWLSGREKRQVTGVVIRKDGLGYNAPRGQRRTTRAMVCNLCRKLKAQGGCPAAEDWLQWARVRGRVSYADNLRAYGEANGADPSVQEGFWNYLMEVFAK